MLYDALQIGPFTIQYFLIVVLLTFFLTYYVIDAFLKESDLKQFIQKNYWTVMTIVILTYKFGPVLLHPHLLLTNKWLFLTGGINGIYLGVLISFIYLLWKVIKRKESFKVFIYAFLMMFMSYHILFQLIKIVVLSFG